MCSILGNTSHTRCCFENNPRNLCQADLASALTTSLHLLPNRHCSADKGLWCNMFTNRTNTAARPVIMGPGESHRHIFRSMRTRITGTGLEKQSARERRARREKAPHSHHLRNWAHDARKRPRLRPSYITWNPFVLLQCICTTHSSPPTH